MKAATDAMVRTAATPGSAPRPNPGLSLFDTSFRGNSRNGFEFALLSATQRQDRGVYTLGHQLSDDERNVITHFSNALRDRVLRSQAGRVLSHRTATANAD